MADSLKKIYVVMVFVLHVAKNTFFKFRFQKSCFQQMTGLGIGTLVEDFMWTKAKCARKW